MRENGFFLSLPGRLKSEENEVVAEMFSGKDEVERPAGSRDLRKRRAEFGKDEAGGKCCKTRVVNQFSGPSLKFQLKGTCFN